MNVIWNKKELKEIKAVILTRVSLKLDENNDLMERKAVPSNCAIGQYAYNNLINEITSLYYFNDKKVIDDTLERASKVNFDISNPLHFGLISALSKIDKDDRAGVFVIFKEIVSQYQRVIDTNVKQLYGNYDIDDLTYLYETIKDSKEQTEIEKIVNETMSKIFSYSNGINECELFKSLCDSQNNKVKDNILKKISDIIASKAKIKEAEQFNIISGHKSDFGKKIETRYKREIKEHGRLY